MAPHGFVDEDLGRGLGHRSHVQRGFAHRHGGVLGSRTEAGAGVGDGQVVVHGLGYADAGQRVVVGLGQLRDLQRGIGRVVAAVVEEVAHVVGLEHFQQAVVLGFVHFQRLQLVAARAERATRSVRQGADGRGRLLGGVDEILAQCTQDAVARSQHLDLAGSCLRNDCGGGRVDDGGDAAGLRIK